MRLGLFLTSSAVLGLALYLLNRCTKLALSQEQLIVEQINQSNLGWTATTYEGLDMKLGLLPGKSLLGDVHNLPLKSFGPEELTAVPDSFDSRTAWPNCESIKDIRNQASCGSCWAFSAATVLSDRLCIGSSQTIQTRLSPEDVLSCCFSCGNGCDGGFPNAAWEYFMTSGIVSGNSYGQTQWCKSYTIPPDGKSHSTPDCKRTCDSVTTNYFTNKTRATTGYLLVGEASFKAEISKNGPIVAAFTVYADFKQYKSGVYYHQSGDVLGGHAIRVVGYGTENGMPYWTIANTWSSSWGENGYFRIRRGVNECGIEAEGLAGLVNV